VFREEEGLGLIDRGDAICSRAGWPVGFAAWVVKVVFAAMVATSSDEEDGSNEND
jgi:hypothetical protein